MKLRFFLLGFLFIVAPTFGQQVLPFVENFNKSDYQGDNQVWNVTQGEDHALYFANNHNLVRYNGVQWDKFQLPNKTIIRSVYADGKRIYSGSYNEFGYWERKQGKMHYHSLSARKKLFLGNSVNEEIWKIFKFKEVIYFQSFNQLYALNGISVRKIDLPGQISYCFPIDSRMYIATVNNGVYSFDGVTMQPQKQWSILENKIIHGIERLNNQLYFFTRNHGVFVANNSSITPWNHALNLQLQSELINSAKMIDSHRLAIGTAFKGVYIVDLQNQTFTNINRNNALKNNSILSICLDNEKDLWLGMDNGIAHIEINSPFLTYNDTSGVLGTVYAIAPFENGYLLGSNHGLFRYQNNVLQLVKGSQGQVWQIDKIGANYVIGHNDGTFTYSAGNFAKLSPVTGGWKLYKSPFGDGYYQANYSGIALYDSHLQYQGKLDKIQKPIRNVIQISPDELYAVDNYKSLYKILLEQGKVSQVINITALNKIKNDFNVRLFEFKGSPFFYLNNQWYTINQVTNKLESNALFNSNFKAITSCTSIDDDHFLIGKNGLLFVITFENNQFKWQLIPKKYYQGKNSAEDTQVVKQGNKLIINLDDGFFIYDYLAHRKPIQQYPIEGYYNHSLIDDATTIQFNQTVDINILTPYFGFNREDLFYKLNEEGEYKSADGGHITLNNLHSGTQEIRIYKRQGANFQQVGYYSFQVAKPWYFSVWMILVYLILISGGLFLYYRWNKVRYIEKLRLKEEEMRHQQVVYQLELDADNKLKIQEYEKSILEIQVQKKASEVAGKSLSIAKQSEMIDSILKLLEKENDLDSLKSNIKKVIKLNSINKKEWETFENNLYKSHEDFVKRLTAHCDKLTSKDIKLCIYLKMSLSSKEIAPLMNISFRGVELHRYRLRKKLNLASDTSLSSFINTL
ncbi:helix-turn-helix and ligand-binding sensor domain-containing protein [Flavobacterium stagni]|uniref:Histidine kinase n=1 Tax=Flavobacterium stagni TaxID=2506421 RepID=A0A4Q1KBF1_9FLAO|nr:LuxR C-terminal-related transcriptional regulator [Flavobacterium stagni]RXR23418.1 histidine kinase [Flavobacterium stagni]